MSVRLTLILGLALLPGAPALAEPPVTSPESPSPAKHVAALWQEAKRQAEQVRERDPAKGHSEPLRMLLAVERDTPLAPGVGWYDPGRSAHDWAWLARRCDGDGDGRVARKEFPGPAELFDRLDRDRDGTVTAEDLDWSTKSKVAIREELSLRLFRLMDGNGNGRVTAEEMRAAFDKLARQKDHLTVEDLQAALGGERGRGKRVTKEKWIECLVAGDLGSPFEGPRVGQPAPDFTLPTQDGKRTVTLSEFRGKRPVVLIFGSFT